MTTTQNSPAQSTPTAAPLYDATRFADSTVIPSTSSGGPVFIRSLVSGTWHLNSADIDRTETNIPALCGFGVHPDRQAVTALDGDRACNDCRDVVNGTPRSTTARQSHRVEGWPVDDGAILAPPAPPAPPAALMFDDVSRLDVGTLERADIERGRRAVYAWRHSMSFPWSTATVADVVAYWQARHAAYIEDVTTAARKLRAAARLRSWQDYYRESMFELVESSTTPLPAVLRIDVERRTSMHAASTCADSEESLTCAAAWPVTAPPARLSDIREQAGVLDVLRAVRVVEDYHGDTLTALADVFLTAANDHEWCTEYEATVRDLNDSMSTYAGRPFLDRDRERDYTVDGHATVTIRLSVPVSTTVTASDEDAASDAAYDVLGDDIDEQLCDALGVSWATYQSLRRTADIEVDDIEVDDVNESDY